MLTITIPPEKEADIWDESINEFIHKDAFNGCTLNLEHSLISISKWESKWHVPFLSKEKKTEEQTMHYIKCMTINQGINDNVYDHLTVDNIKDISEYINDPMSATVIIPDPSQPKNRKIITSERIYYWMSALQIPFEPCQKWHLNRLLQLIAVANEENTPPKKMSKSEIMARNRVLNAQRRAKYNSKG
ncbi:MAG: hypothetical protein J6U54_25145 [Clostridiales bacterium]|nr:hypothetical protein [Clostridiales bacterium]